MTASSDRGNGGSRFSVPPATSPPYIDPMDAITFRVEHLERDMHEVRSVLTRLAPKIDEMHGMLTGILPTLATKGELTSFRSELFVAVHDRPSKTYMWAIIGVLTATILAAVAVGAMITIAVVQPGSPTLP